MATRLFCDGCDRQFQAHELTLVRVATTAPPGEHKPVDVAFDLCVHCLNRFRKSYPTMWARDPAHQMSKEG